jgi:NTE family protein
VRYDAAETYQIVKGTDFKDFEDRKNIARLLTTYGLYKGQTLLEWIQEKITRKGLAETATFLDLQKAGYRDLHVFSTDLNMQNITTFSVDQTPHVVVAEAVRASMSIPMFFKAWKFTDANPDGHIYVDGGVLYNYPIGAFDSGGDPNPETLGFYLTDLKNLAVPNDLDYDHVLQYVKFLFETLLDSQDVDFKNDPEQEVRTVLVDDFGISSTNFDITPEQINQLYQSGIDCTIKYLDGKQSPIHPVNTGK